MLTEQPALRLIISPVHHVENRERVRFEFIAIDRFDDHINGQSKLALHDIGRLNIERQRACSPGNIFSLCR